MSGPGDPKDQSITDMYLHSGGVLGEILYIAKASIVDPIAVVRQSVGLDPEPPPPPGPARPLQRPVPLSDLEFTLHVMPWPVGFVGGSVTIVAEVKYKALGADGKPGKFPYPEKWIEILYRGDTIEGPGPKVLQLDNIGEFAVVLRAWAGSGKTVKLTTKKIISLCGAQLPADPVLKEITCLLFGEGGSLRKPMLDEREFRAIAWSLKHRYELLEKAKADNNERLWRYAAGRFFKQPNENVPYSIDHRVNYHDLFAGYKQYTGYNSAEFRICSDPAANVKAPGQDALTCTLIQRTSDMVDAVFSKNSKLDPYANQGNARYPGVYYYKNKGNTPPADPAKSPIFPELTGRDVLFYQGLEDDAP